MQAISFCKNSGSLLCGPPCLSAFSPLLFTVLHRLGQRQAKDDVIGGRTLTEDIKLVRNMLHARREASPITFDGLPLKLNSEVQNMLMHGTPGSGKSNAMNKLLIQLRQRAIW